MNDEGKTQAVILHVKRSEFLGTIKTIITYKVQTGIGDPCKIFESTYISRLIPDRVVKIKSGTRRQHIAGRE